MRSSKDLSPRQERILSFIETFIQERGYSPSIRDIQVNLKISSTSVVAYNLKALQEKGKLDREGKISRGIRLLSTGITCQIPIVGDIATHLALPNLNEMSLQHCDTLEVPATMIPKGQSPTKKAVALRVQGSSLLDALVTDGDMVVVQPSSHPTQGDTIIGMLRNEEMVFMRRYHPDGKTLTLQPLNPELASITTAVAEVTLFGIVVGMLRMVRSVGEHEERKPA